MIVAFPWTFLLLFSFCYCSIMFGVLLLCLVGPVWHLGHLSGEKRTGYFPLRWSVTCVADFLLFIMMALI